MANHVTELELALRELGMPQSKIDEVLNDHVQAAWVAKRIVQMPDMPGGMIGAIHVRVAVCRHLNRGLNDNLVKEVMADEVFVRAMTNWIIGHNRGFVSVCYRLFDDLESTAQAVAMELNLPVKVVSSVQSQVVDKAQHLVNQRGSARNARSRRR